MKIPASPKPVYLKDALLSGDTNARFCVYKADENGIVHPRICNAEAAKASMDDGWFDNSVDAKSADNKEVTEPPSAPDEAPDTGVHPSQMDKRTKEYKEWKASQEDSE